MDQVAPADPEVLRRLPNRPVLTAYELFNWIAFGRAAHVDLTGLNAFTRRWGCGPGQSHALELVAQELTGTLAPADRALLDAAEKRPPELMWAATKIDTTSKEYGYTPLEAALFLLMQLGDYRKRVAQLDRAEEAVIDALKGGRLVATATPSRKPEPGEVGLQPIDFAADLPARIFRTVGIRISLDGTISALGIDKLFLGAEFLTADVAEIWPADALGTDQATGGGVPLRAVPSTVSDKVAPGRRRRRHTGRDYRQADVPLVREMRRMIEASEACSATNAARAVVKGAAGNGNDASKVARLVKLYGETHADA